MLKLLGLLDLFVAGNLIMIALGVHSQQIALLAMIYVIIKVFVFPLPLVNLVDLFGAITGIVFVIIPAGSTAAIALGLLSLWFIQKGIVSLVK